MLAADAVSGFPHVAKSRLQTLESSGTRRPRAPRHASGRRSVHLRHQTEPVFTDDHLTHRWSGEFAERSYVLRAGEIVLAGTREELLDTPDLANRFLGF